MMRIGIPDDYQKVIRGLEAFKILDGHEVTVVHDNIVDVPAFTHDNRGGTFAIIT